MFNFSQIFKFAIKDILSQKKLNLFFSLNLTLGFLGFLLLQIFQSSLNVQTLDKAKEILGGDISISARREISDSEIQNIEKLFAADIQRKSKSVNLFAMIKSQNNARLVMLKAVDHQYPLYGEIEVNHNGQAQKIQKISKDTMYVDPEVIDQLKINSLNEVIQIGRRQAKVNGIISNDPSRSFQLGTLAPFVFFSIENLIETDLIKPGSTLTTTYYYQLKDSNRANEIKQLLEKNILDSSIRFTSALQDDEGGNQVFRYLIDYLGLVALISIGLSFLCLSYMLNWFFQIQKKNLAIYKILGLNDFSILSLQAIKNLILSSYSFVVAGIFLWAFSPFLQNILNNYFKIKIQLNIQFNEFLISFLIVILGPQLIAIPSYILSYKTNPLALIRNELSFATISRSMQLYWSLTVLSVFWILSIFQSHSVKTGSIFILGLVLSIICVWFLVWFLRQILEKSVLRLGFENKYAVLSLIRKSASTNLIFMTMTLSIVILTLLPHIKKSIIEEVRPSQESKIPSAFLFDIQMDQKDQLVSEVEALFKQKLELTPLVRSRILKINEQNYERVSEQGIFKTREDEAEARFRNRGVNLTYKLNLQDSEQLVKGKWFDGVYKENPKDTNHLPEISLEQKYAERINANINDVITFDVQGLEIKAKVTSLRRVRWTSFRPNFFIVFQPGVLEEAPQNYLSSLMNLKQDEIQTLQLRVVDLFPNISIINVKQTVEKSLGFIDQMALALQIMAWLALLVGFFVFIILLNTQISERINEMNLLQVLGSSQKQITSIIMRQFTSIAVLSLILGLSLGAILSYVVMGVIFKITISFDIPTVLIIALLLAVLTYFILKVSLKPLKRIQPIQLLKMDGSSN